MATPEGTFSEMWPGITIWAYPRIAIRRIINEGARPSPIAWAAFRGFATVLIFQPPTSVSQGDWNFGLLLAVAILGPLLNIAFMYLLGIVTAKSGHWLGGLATRSEARTAWAWSAITLIPLLVLWLLAVIAGVASANWSMAGTSFVVQTLYPLANVLVPLWGLGIFWFGLSEVQQFSLGRGVLSLLISLVLLTLFTILLALMLAPCFTTGTLLVGIVAAIFGAGQ